MLKINYTNNFDRNKYCEKLEKSETLFNQYKNEKIGKFDTLFQDISFKCIVIGKFNTIQKLKEKIGTSDDIKNNKYILEVFNYTKYQSTTIKPFFEDNLIVSTCYYCNIDFVNSYNTDVGNKNKFTIDHYYDKATYPYLGLSLYNFIPSCYTCNSKLKKNKEFKNVAPSSKYFDFEHKVKFKLFLDKDCKNLHVKDKKDIDIPLKEQFSNEYDKYIEVFKLNERYKAHKDIVYEMITKVELYPESRLKELQYLTGIPFQQIKKDIFNLSDEEDLSKKPFSKLIKDISEELKLT
ncbi:hypothetical protein ALC152_19400 [Arcobacter sp. 15-2]|uniref:hypothetical protein n=1 Tax=Arcobacter sp. 15-2 TaxID=3374109 RepID=UPI00399C7980